MIRSSRTAALALAVSLAVASCTTGSHDDDASRPSSRSGPVPLENLRAIPLQGDPLEELGDGVEAEGTRPVAELRIGGDRLVTYLDRKSCGLAVTGPGEVGFGLKAAWPEDDGDAQIDLPGGPYAQASSMSSFERRSTWTQLSCGKRAMVVEYGARDARAATSGARGAMSVVRPRDGKTWFVVVGPKDVRAGIAAKLSAWRPADVPR
ncbi:hypothetical protein [Streptomyces lasiicapitis]|uniref:hypothetical protein n=1 Tax=Streptomyces lasiicapitis TaxID=1923961 RepID=UPI00365DB5C6